MNERLKAPQRWLDGGGPAGTRELLASARRPLRRTDEERARSQRLVAQLAAKPAALGLLSTLLGKALLATSVTVAAGAGAWSLRAQEEPALVANVVVIPAQGPGSPARSERRAQAPDPTLAAPPRDAFKLVAPMRLQPSASPLVVAAPTPGATVEAPTPTPETPTSSITEEARLVDRARAIVLADPHGADALLAEHARRFPAGVLSTERDLLAIESLVRQGRTDEARMRRADFGSKHPSAAYQRKLRWIFSEPDTNP
ncbi:MAG: hypothetical protein HOO96_25465 [Polyangiaceae bacterium]|nr:hypothetical protein [Polyangiaceae bacterium]